MKLSDIERNYTIKFDFRNDETNERKTIYQVVNNSLYILIHKQNGSTIAKHDAQNALTLILKHLEGSGWRSSSLK